jgi:hypothetical protein
MQAVDNALMYTIMRESHCPDSRCAARYRPGSPAPVGGGTLARVLRVEGIPLAHLRDFFSPERGSVASLPASC